jgi:prepilin-type N-terminal cleavage/methylation domain-containing protein
MCTQTRRVVRGFTLVELLVVIGIISLLISMLLPALKKARQQANQLDCQARLRQMGQALYIYANANRNYFPFGVIDRPEPWEDNTFPNPQNKEFSWWWYMTLSDTLSHNLMGSDGFVHNLSKVFQDRDTIDSSGVFYVNHYVCNERIFYSNYDNDYGPNSVGKPMLDATKGEVQLRRLGSVKPTSVFLFWDGPQSQDLGGNTYGSATELDGNELTFGHYFFLNTPNPAVNYNRPVSPGLPSQSQSATLCKTAQIKFNIDLNSYLQFVHLRFRHLSNKSMNALCLDGHVETRRVGEAMVTDFCIKNPY